MPEDSQDSLLWSDWPARRDPGRAALAGVVVVAAVVAIATIEPWLAVVGGALLLGAVSEALLPARYRVDAEGVSVDRGLGRRQLRWERVDELVRHPDGILVRARGARRWLARRHDLLLRHPPPTAWAQAERYSSTPRS